jgi:hypothetical protein
MKREEPTPLLNAGPEDRELFELLDAGRSDLPADETVDALEARILPLLTGPPSGFPPPADPTGGGAAAGGAATAAGGAAAGGAIAGGAALGKLATAVVLAGAVVAGTWALATRDAKAPREAPRSHGATTQAPVEEDAPHVEPPEGADTPAGAVVEVDEPPAPVSPVARSARPRRIAREAAPSPTPEPAHEAEATLLSRAQAALAASPSEALRLTREHEVAFADGLLAPEREVIAIDALLRLGRTGEARARAERFLSRAPSSAHARRIRVMLTAASSEAD